MKTEEATSAEGWIERWLAPKVDDEGSAAGMIAGIFGVVGMWVAEFYLRRNIQDLLGSGFVLFVLIAAFRVNFRRAFEILGFKRASIQILATIAGGFGLGMAFHLLNW